MKNINILVFLFFLSNLLSSLNFAHAEMVYPIQTMSKLECRFQDYSTLWDECKMPLPILKTSDYTKYKNDYNLYRRVYTVLWGASYDYWWDVGNGWHQWVDIATSKWTPVYAITDWKVVFASNIFWRWNTVKIEHTINWRKVYSNYSHLSKIDVWVWDKVKARTKIWEVWNTWNTTWNHLHFQIDLSVSWRWPRYRSDCSEKNYDIIVNSGICFNQLKINTIDPLLFLETSWAIIKENIINKPKQEVISKEWLLSRQEILKREIEEFLKIYDVKVNIINLWWNIEFWKSWTFRIKIVDKKTKKPFTWSFPGNMNFKFDQKKFDIFPTWILQIDNWIRDFKVTPKMPGKMVLEIYIWEIFLKKITFWVIDTKKRIIPKTWVLYTNKTNVISDNSKAILYFKDNFWLNLLWLKFDWKFKLKSPNKSVKFCIKKWNSLSEINYLYNSNCDHKYFKDEVEFSYDDTISWILVFNYKVTNIWLNTLTHDYNSKPFLSRNLLWIEPYWLDVNHPYYIDIINVSKNWLASWIYKWYFMQDKELSTLDWINMLNALLDYKISRCNSNDCKNFYLQKSYELSKYKVDKYTYFTRGEYIKLIWDTIDLKAYTWSDFILFRDLSQELQEYSKNILKNKTWNDYFWKTRYFQPNKKITRWEWAFLINNVLD